MLTCVSLPARARVGDGAGFADVSRRSNTRDDDEEDFSLSRTTSPDPFSKRAGSYEGDDDKPAARERYERVNVDTPPPKAQPAAAAKPAR